METIEEREKKESLRNSADELKAQLETELEQSLEQISKLAKVAAAVAGGVLIGYSVYKVFFESEESKKRKKLKGKSKKSEKGSGAGSSFFDPILRAGGELAATYLLAIAKRKLQEYIINFEEGPEQPDEHS